MRNAILEGKIHAISGQYATVKFPQYDDAKDYQVPINQPSCQGDKFQVMPQVGSQVLVAFTEQGTPYIISTFYTESNNRPYSSLDKFGVTFDDGTEITYDKSSKEVTISGATTVSIDANDVNISGDLTVNGTVQGSTVTNGNDSIAEVVLVYNLHTHGGVTAGVASTGGPAPTIS